MPRLGQASPIRGLPGGCRMLAVGTAGEALDLAGQELGPSLDILVVPHATLARPKISNEDHAYSRKCARPVARRTDRIVS